MSHSDVGFYDYADNSVKYDKAIVNLVTDANSN